MSMWTHGKLKPENSGERIEGRFWFMYIVFFLIGCAIIVRLGYLQLYQNGFYAMLASDQHDMQTKLIPSRGQIFARDHIYGTLYPLATNRTAWSVYAVPRNIVDKPAVARTVSDILGIPYDDVYTKLTKRDNDPYEVLIKDVHVDAVENLKTAQLQGIGFLSQNARLYPEKNISGQLIGFVTDDEKSASLKGRYGIESSYDDILRGRPGSMSVEKDAKGNTLSTGNTQLNPAENGSDLILTIDRSVQFKTCNVVAEAVKKYQADSGTIIIMNPNTGAILAMCSAPNFDSADFKNVEDVADYSNKALYTSYEPGSVFKPIIMSSAIDAEKVTPNTTYEDMGFINIDEYKIRNSDHAAHGVQTMVQVLEKSLNTGMVFVEKQLGHDLFLRYIKGFGFGEKTNIGVTPESAGDISNIEKTSKIFMVTASYGQGITMTPMQIVRAYAAMGNGGKLVRPYIVDEIVHADGSREKTKSIVVNQVISSRTSQLITGMLIDVVEKGHGKKAGVPGYWVAGKTGTAQVAKAGGGGYQKNINIGSFAGYAPANNPRFAMIVKIEHPRDVAWAEASAAPIFGEMASYLLTYMQIPPERPLIPIKESIAPEFISSTTTSITTSTKKL